jgi:hypothetical protein
LFVCERRNCSSVGVFFNLPRKRKRWFFPQQWGMVVRGAQEGMLSEQKTTTTTVCQWLTQSVSGMKLNSLGDQRVQHVVVPAQCHSYHGLAATTQLPGLLLAAPQSAQVEVQNRLCHGFAYCGRPQRLQQLLMMKHIPLRVLRVRGCLHKIPFTIVIPAHSIRWWQRFQILKHYQRKSLGLSNRLFSWVISRCFLGWLHLSMEKFLKYGDHIWIPLISVEFLISCFLVAMTEDVLWGYMCMQVLEL